MAGQADPPTEGAVAPGARDANQGAGQGGGGRRYAVLGLAAAVLVATVLGAAAWMTRRSDPPTPAAAPVAVSKAAATPSASASPRASTSPLTPQEQAATAAQAAYRAYIKALDDIAASGGKSLGSLDAISVGEARLAGFNSAQDFSSDGSHAVGTTRVPFMKVTSVSINSKPPTVVLQACVDSTGVFLVDRHGQTKPAAIPYGGEEVMVVRKPSGSWIVVSVADRAMGACG